MSEPRSEHVRPVDRARQIRSWAESHLPPGDRARYFIGELTTIVMEMDQAQRRRDGDDGGPGFYDDGMGVICRACGDDVPCEHYPDDYGWWPGKEAAQSGSDGGSDG